MRGAATENAVMPIVRFVLGTKRSLFADARGFDLTGIVSATGTTTLLMYCGVCPSITERVFCLEAVAQRLEHSAPPDTEGHYRS